MKEILSKNDVVEELRNVSKELIASAPPIGMPDDCILHDKSKFTKQHHHGRARWEDKKGNQYTWDALHGEIEMFDKNNRHMASLDKDGNFKKKAVPGRRLK